MLAVANRELAAAGGGAPGQGDDPKKSKNR
jgi:hypothetical protein